MYKKQVTDIVNFVIETELEQFKQDFDLAPIPVSQDLSSLSIEWLCYYFKENVSKTNLTAITSFVDEIRIKENYNVHGWMRIAALQGAAYVLTGDENYLIPLLENIACMQSTTRVFMLQSVSVIAPLLDFENDYLKEAVELNVYHNHDCADESILLLLSTNGPDELKMEWLKYELAGKQTNSTALLKVLLEKNSVVDNDFYQSIFNEIKNHILFRILKHSYSFNNQTSLFSDNKRVFPKTLNSFQDNHPLDRTKFEFNLYQE